MSLFPDSELPINADGTAFHLHLLPSQLRDKVLLVGDPGRVPLVATHFDSIDYDVSNREYHAIAGTYHGKELLCLSTGIGCGNIDIVVNELDALANIDFTTRELKDSFRQLTLVRVGTCGGLQPFTPCGTFIATVKSIGFDGLMNYYGGSEQVCDIPLERAFTEHMQWSSRRGAPYVTSADTTLLDRIAQDDMVRGITVTCGGFYGPQGRQLRIPLGDPDQNEKLRQFTYHGLQVTNIEMESSALAGLSAILGHRAMTCCVVVANRYAQQMNTNYTSTINDLIELVLSRL